MSDTDIDTEFLSRQDKVNILTELSFGARTAEEESEGLSHYFIQTDYWKKIYNGDVDIIYGAKGSGKSAIYTLLEKSKNEYISRNILIAGAENPRGATVFRHLVTNPPSEEQEFIFLWKVYIIGLLGNQFQQFDMESDEAKRFLSRLTDLRLIPEQASLSKLFRAAKDFVTSYLSRQSIRTTWTANIDPTTGIPVPSVTSEYAETKSAKFDDLLRDFSPDDILADADDVLTKEGFKSWLMFDRLDIAFEESRVLEMNALRALFKTYNDLRSLRNVSLKIFVRDDIWRRITERGFSEASHITRQVTIKWNKESLLNLAVRRMVNNKCVTDVFEGDKGRIQQVIMNDFGYQKSFFYMFFPQQIDLGPNKPETFEWILGRTKDGTGLNTPRELIHFLTELRSEQISRLQRGEEAPPDNELFDRVIFKEALKSVSETRLTQTLIAEYPELRSAIMALDNEKTLQTTTSLAAIWKIDFEAVQLHAAKLVAVGFFEQRGTKSEPQFWIPFIYRDALHLVQGSAET